jgi:predicted amidohydrolase
MTAEIGACQFEPVVGDPAANVDSIDASLGRASESLAVAVFPELALTGYDLDAAQEHAGPVPGPLTDPLVTVAADHDVSLVVGVPERAGDEYYNTLVYVTPDGVEATYRKLYRWGDEAQLFAAGEELPVVETPVGDLGFALCYDLNFPELGLAYSRKGIDVLAVSAAWRQSFAADWRLLCRARALDGPCYVAGSNHTGSQSGRVHAGGSLLAGPSGSVLSEAGEQAAVVSTPVREDTLADGRGRNPVRQTRDERSRLADGSLGWVCPRCRSLVDATADSVVCQTCRD